MCKEDKIGYVIFITIGFLAVVMASCSLGNEMIRAQIVLTACQDAASHACTSAVARQSKD